MKKLLKKLKLFFIRSSAFISAALVFLCSFASPALAAGVTSDPTAQIYYSYWNLTKMIVTYNDGTIAIFDLPTTFYETNSYYTNDIVIDSLTSDKTLSLRCYVGSTVIQKPSASYIFNARDFQSVSFVFEDSVIRYYPTNFGPTSMPPTYNREETVPIIQFPNSTNVISNFSGYLENTRPVYGSSEDDFTFKFETTNSYYGLTESDPFSNDSIVNGQYLYDLFPYSLLQSELAYYRDNISVNTALHIPYYPIVKTDITFDFSNVSSDIYNIGISLPLGAATNNYSFNPVSEWYARFFSGYKQFGDGATVDFVSWISTAVGGFLAFEIIPGISFGLLLTFIIGIASVNFFLKFFAGG
jgi:hypothetical protein